MPVWVYNENEFSEKSYSLIPEGVYRVRIEKAEDATSKSSDKDMIKLTLAVSGYNSKLWSYIVLDDSTDEARKRTNQRIGTIFSSFGISEHTMHLPSWEGRVGGAKVRHKKDPEGNTRAEIAYFLYGKEVAQLPDWLEPGSLEQNHRELDNVQDNVINPEMVDPSVIPF